MLGYPEHVLKDASNNVNQIPWSQSTSRHIYHNITYKMSRIAKINSATSIALVTGDIKDCMIPASWRKAPWAQWRWIRVQAPTASDPVRICIGACRVGNLEWNESETRGTSKTWHAKERCLIHWWSPTPFAQGGTIGYSEVPSGYPSSNTARSKDRLC